MNGATASAAGDPSVSDVVTRAPTSASCASVGPAPSSSPSCQATTPVAHAAERQGDDRRDAPAPAEEPGRRTEQQAGAGEHEDEDDVVGDQQLLRTGSRSRPGRRR